MRGVSVVGGGKWGSVRMRSVEKSADVGKSGVWVRECGGVGERVVTWGCG